MTLRDAAGGGGTEAAARPASSSARVSASSSAASSSSSNKVRGSLVLIADAPSGAGNSAAQSVANSRRRRSTRSGAIDRRPEREFARSFLSPDAMVASNIKMTCPYVVTAQGDATPGGGRDQEDLACGEGP